MKSTQGPKSWGGGGGKKPAVAQTNVPKRDLGKWKQRLKPVQA